MNDPTVRFDAAINHLGVIMDGNGRWAKQKGLPRSAGHQAGVQALKRLVSFAGEYNIRIITAFALFHKNWQRPSSEVSLMRLLAETITKEIDELEEKGVHLRFIGRLQELPEDLLRSLDRAVARTAANDKLVLNVALNYGGPARRSFDAVRKIADLVQEGQVSIDNIDEELVARQMMTGGLPDPDLIIRTGGSTA